MIKEKYYKSLKFDKERVLVKNESRVNNLNIIKVVGNYSKKKKYNYVKLGEKIIDTKDIIIVIDNDDLVLSKNKNIIKINTYLDNKDEKYINKNGFNKIYSNIKNDILFSVYKNIIKVYKFCKKYDCKVKDIYLVNYDKNLNNNNVIKELDSIIYAYTLDKEKRFNFIYDYMCDYLDSEFMRFNLCDFNDNRCVSRRDLECKGCKNPLTYGCCYTKGRVCPNLINSRCTIKSLPCKFFTCRYLERQGIKYRPWDYLIINLFFNHREKVILDQSLYTEKEIIINRLLERRKINYFYNGIKRLSYSFNIVL